jgi:cathepsin A (carboxypeptidase C)
MRNRFLQLAVVGLLACSTLATKDEFFTGEEYRSGLVNLTKGDDMFYWLFESKSAPSTDPLVMWLTGGPGCASEVALFYENGPYKINDDLSLSPNAYTWNQVSNLLYVD